MTQQPGEGNSRTDITTYKVITAKYTAKYNDKPLTGGFDATGKADPASTSFCDAKRPDLNQCN